MLSPTTPLALWAKGLFVFHFGSKSFFLDIKELLDLTCKTVANMIKGKTPDEIRKTFNIQDDFTPEEEEAVRKENECKTVFNLVLLFD